MIENHTFWRQWRDGFLMSFIPFSTSKKNRPAMLSRVWNSWGPLRVHLIQESTSDGEQTLLLARLDTLISKLDDMASHWLPPMPPSIWDISDLQRSSRDHPAENFIQGSMSMCTTWLLMGVPWDALSGICGPCTVQLGHFVSIWTGNVIFG